MDYAAAANHPKTSEQIVITGQQLVSETGMFTEKLESWRGYETALQVLG